MAQQSQGTAHQRAQQEHPTLKYRRFGRTGWKVSEIGYGMWGMGGWTGSDDAESLASLQRAVDLDCNFFDTNLAASDAGPLHEALHAELRKHRWVRKPTPWSM